LTVVDADMLRCVWDNAIQRTAVCLPTNSLCAAESFFRSSQLLGYLRNSEHFMEPEGTLPCSKEPSTGPCPEPEESNSYHSILFHLNQFEYYSPTYFKSFILAFLLKSYMLSSSLYVCYIFWPSHRPWFDHSNYIWQRIMS
jgi:hypothetical protein